MAASNVQTLYVNVTTGFVSTAIDNTTAPTGQTLILRQWYPLKIVFHEAGSVVELTDATFTFSIKPSGAYTGPAMVPPGSWTQSGTGTDSVYTLSDYILSQSLLEQLGEDDSKAFKAQITWVISGNPNEGRSYPWDVTILNSPASGNERLEVLTADQSRTVFLDNGYADMRTFGLNAWGTLQEAMDAVVELAPTATLPVRLSVGAIAVGDATDATVDMPSGADWGVIIEGEGRGISHIGSLTMSGGTIGQMQLIGVQATELAFDVDVSLTMQSAIVDQYTAPGCDLTLTGDHDTLIATMTLDGANGANGADASSVDGEDGAAGADGGSLTISGLAVVTTLSAKGGNGGNGGASNGTYLGGHHGGNAGNGGSVSLNQLARVDAMDLTAGTPGEGSDAQDDITSTFGGNGGNGGNGGSITVDALARVGTFVYPGTAGGAYGLGGSGSGSANGNLGSDGVSGTGPTVASALPIYEFISSPPATPDAGVLIYNEDHALKSINKLGTIVTLGTAPGGSEPTYSGGYLIFSSGGTDYKVPAVLA